MKELKKRLEFVITLTLFFPVILEAMYKSASNEPQSATMILLWGVVIVVLILDYLFIEFRKEKVSDWSTKWTDRLLVLQVAMFIPVLFVLASAQQGLLSFFYLLSFSVGLIGLMSIPAVIFILLIIDLFISEVKEFNKI